jgi:hypothetical protein
VHEDLISQNLETADMANPRFDRFRVQMKPLAERRNKQRIERDQVVPDTIPKPLDAAGTALVATTTERIRRARDAGKPVMLSFGAHTIKNCLAPVLIQLLENGWITHLATNGAGIIHDWEFAYQGESSEDVEVNVEAGEFGNWQETGFTINLALVVGAYEGKGYGEAIGSLIHHERLNIPAAAELKALVRDQLDSDPKLVAAAADLLWTVERFDLAAGPMAVAHDWKQYSVQAAAYRLGIPFTGHPMIGHDIIYNHPMNHGGAVGRTALRDFLTFADSVSHLDGGVYLSVGSAVMSPMVFEKSMSMAQNLALQNGRRLDSHFILVADLAKSRWDWSQGEPPEDNPDYYLRYNKTFSRMGGTMGYLCADNRDLLLMLAQQLG